MTLHIAGVKLSKALGIQDRFLKSDRQGISTRQIDEPRKSQVVYPPSNLEDFSVYVI